MGVTDCCYRAPGGCSRLDYGSLTSCVRFGNKARRLGTAALARNYPRNFANSNYLSEACIQKTAEHKLAAYLVTLFQTQRFPTGGVSSDALRPLTSPRRHKQKVPRLMVDVVFYYNATDGY